MGSERKRGLPWFRYWSDGNRRARERIGISGIRLFESDRANLFTASGIEIAPRVRVQRIGAVGHERSDFSVLGYTLPAEIGVDGILGLDFLRGFKLTVDFREGHLSLD